MDNTLILNIILQLLLSLANNKNPQPQPTDDKSNLKTQLLTLGFSLELVDSAVDLGNKANFNSTFLAVPNFRTDSIHSEYLEPRTLSRTFVDVPQLASLPNAKNITALAEQDVLNWTTPKEEEEKDSVWTREAVANLTNAGLTAADGLATTLYNLYSDPKTRLNLDKPLDTTGSVLDAASDVAGNFGPWGAVVSAGLKGIGIINKWTGANTQLVDLSSGVAASSAFLGDKEDISADLNKYSKGFVGGLARLFGKEDRINDRLNRRKRDMSYIEKVLSESKNAMNATANQALLTGERVNQILSGGTSYRGLV